ncbi:TVP38/TMEM64 family protein [Kordiimonas sp.]|uniref:TVP38/TMEM64 family protein n=1 Tax=Kordiimonas sp. TaxID=1970157 RepID=UPI003A94F22E
MTNFRLKATITLTLATIAVVLLAVSGDYLSLDFIQQNIEALKQEYNNAPIAFAVAFIGFYLMFVALYLPGPFVLNLLAGAIFGPLVGTVLASFAAALGSVAAFAVSRYILYDAVRGRFPGQAISMDKTIEEKGSFYVLLLRLMPGLPVGLTNLLMGVTSISAMTFFTATLIGVVPWIGFYVVAGGELASIRTPGDIVSLEMCLIALALILLLALGHWLSKRLSDPRTPIRRRGHFV